MSLPKPLMFTIGLIDQITKPIAKISGQLNGLAANYQAGTMQMATGIGGIAASGYALQNALMPAIEMGRAVGEVRSLGVQDSALKMLTQNAYRYALQYGESATEFVRSSYDIQSAIAGLNGADLSRFTMASNVLAKATKADAATVTNYMGTMYGIFKNDAQQLGEGAWVERLTGMTATAIQAFKSDGKKMADAFGALGASAGLAPLQEQMAVLGTLQATMQGGESATKYKAFLGGVGKAQKALGMSFVDSNGQMLPMIEILEKIQAQYGKLDSVQADIDKFDTAFGSKEARQLIQLLLKDVDGLKGSINTLGQVTGMEQAEKMAAAMTDQSQRLAESWYVIRAAIGTAILPSFNSFVGKLAEAGNSVMWFTEMFPNITRWLGYVAVGFFAAVAAGGLFNLMMGAGRMAMVAWGLAGTVMQAALWLFGVQVKKSTTAMLGFNLAMYANPVGLIVAGIVAAIAAIGAMIYYWDDLKASLANTSWGQPILYMMDAIQNLFSVLGKIAVGAFSIIISVAKMVGAALEPLVSFWLSALIIAFKVVGYVAGFIFSRIAAVVGGVINVFAWLYDGIYQGVVSAIALWDELRASMSDWGWLNSIGNFISKAWQGIRNIFTAQLEWIFDKLKLIGIDINMDFSAGKSAEFEPVAAVEAIAPVQTNVPRGGITQQIANANNSKSTSVGTINVYPQKVDADFANYVEMHA